MINYKTMEKLQKELEAIKDQLQQKEAEAAKLTADLQNSQGTASKHEDAVKEMIKAVADLEKTKAELVTEIDALKSENLELRTQSEKAAKVSSLVIKQAGQPKDIEVYGKFKLEKAEYGVMVPKFKFVGKDYTAEDVAASTSLQKKLIEAKAGIIQELVDGQLVSLKGGNE